MPVPAAENQDHPVLAVNIDSGAMRGLLRVPLSSTSKNAAVRGEAKEYAFSLPSPERVLCDRIENATSHGRTLYINCAVMASICSEAVYAHLQAGLGLVLHPETATALGLGPEERKTVNITVAPACPVSAESVSGADFNMVAWRSLLAMGGLPQPGAILVSALERGPIFSSFSGAANGLSRATLGPSFFGLSRFGGRRIASLLCPPLSEEMLRLRAIQRMTGNAVTDCSTAFILGLLSIPGITERSYREGVVLLFAGKHFVSAALVFKDRLLGFFELPSGRVLPSGGRDLSRLLQILDDFRLGWFPGELAAKFGGFVDTVSALPAEAEGFRPLFITGPGAAFLEGHGQIVCAQEDIALTDCRGLLYGYARLREESSPRGGSGGMGIRFPRPRLTFESKVHQWNITLFRKAGAATP